MSRNWEKVKAFDREADRRPPRGGVSRNTADKFSIDGVLAVAQQAKKLTSTRPGLWVRALLTQVRRSDIVTEAEKVLEGMRVEVCRAKIRRTDKVPESTVTLLPLRQYSPGSSACQDYRALASELMEEVQG